MSRLFGTDGVRGIAGKDLTPELAFKLGQAGAYVLTGATFKPKILIGRDTRISGYMIEAALTAGICSVGAQAVILGVVPTACVAYLAKELKADAGIMISASHNTFEYNGIKFFNQNGFKLSDEIEDKIEEHIKNGNENIPLAAGADIGRRVYMKNTVVEYEKLLNSCADQRLDGLKIVLDLAQGAASKIAAGVFSNLGATVIPYYDTPDGANINDFCGSTHPDKLKSLVVELGADLGLAFDGDADRLIAVDEHGNLVDGDKILAILATDFKKRGILKKNTLVATVMSNLGLIKAMEAEDIKVIQTKVGDRYVLERMLEDGYNLGGEQSGHIIYLDKSTTGDGLLTGILLCCCVKRYNTQLSGLAKIVSIMPQVLVNARVSDKKKYGYEEDEVIQKQIEKIENKFKGNGRVLIRPSGTEPFVRVMIEGKELSEIERDAVNLAKLIEQRLS